MLNLESLQACNPSFSIYSQKESNYYVDLADGRSEDVVKRMRRAIALSPNKPTYQLLSGHTGSGKTTELLRLKAGLEQQGFVVIYCATDAYIQVKDIGLTELWLVILNLILQPLEKETDSLSLAYLPHAIAEIEQWLRISPSVKVFTYGQRLQTIIQTLQNNKQTRRQLRHYLEPRLRNSLLAAAEEVTAIEVDRLKQLGKKGLVILVDNLDRLSLEQAEVIFGEGGKYLRQFQCHTIYTLPLLAIAPADQQFPQALETTFQQSLKANSLISLSNLSLRDRAGAVNLESLSLLHQVVLARMFPKTSAQQRLDRVTEICDRLETLDQLCLASHGHLPYLLSLLYGCLQQQDPPIQSATIDRVLQIDHAMRLSTISERDRQSLHKCLSSPYALTLEALNLCRRLLLFEYRDSQGYWFISPFADGNH